jgi:dihydroneopterin aldolase
MSMLLKESYICLHNLRFHAYHGVLPQERVVGNDYTVSLRISYDVSEAMKSDRIEDTLNYAEVYELVKQEMYMQSDLIEHVAYRIGQHLADAFPQIREIFVSITKHNPPLGADCDGSGVELHLIIDKTK